MRPAGAEQVALGGRARAIAGVGALWRFTRPHTIIGTTVSVLGLYAVAAETGHATGAADLAATMIAAWCVNVAIVGLNQIEDVEIDRVNKPELPLAAGDMTGRAAWVLVGTCALVPVAMAITQGPIELAAVTAALLIGAAYSSPPLRLKRFPTVALLSISLVRALAVNLGVFGHFSGSLADVPPVVWALTLFVLPFSAAIALLKDIPDIEGDRVYRIRTFSVRLGRRPVFRAAMAALAVAYAGMLVAAPWLPDVSATTFAAGHVLAVAALATLASRARPDDPVAFTAFYMRVWTLFFFEYAIVATSVLV
jgi:homogentisate phytyltransferase/homogentisate geranylgeranyltransferase